MSLAGIARTRRAVTLRIYRPTAAANTDASDRLTWAAAGSVRAPVTALGEEIARQVFGPEVVVTARALVPVPLSGVLPDLRTADGGDGVLVEGGPYDGRRFRVTGVVPETLRRRIAHVQVALTATDEVFALPEVAP